MSIWRAKSCVCRRNSSNSIGLTHQVQSLTDTLNLAAGQCFLLFARIVLSIRFVDLVSITSRFGGIEPVSTRILTQFLELAKLVFVRPNLLPFWIKVMEDT